MKHFLSIYVAVWMLLSGSVLAIPGESRIPLQHARRFGTLLVQDMQGRIKPLNSLSHELVNKVSKGKSIQGKHPDQVLLGMIISPGIWTTVPMITAGHPEIRSMLNLPESQSMASYRDFFDPHTGQYKLKEALGSVNSESGKTGRLEKELKKIDERINVCYMVYQGYLLKIFPDGNDTWINLHHVVSDKGDSTYTAQRRLWNQYIQAVQTSMSTRQWQRADEALDRLITLQREETPLVIPSIKKVKAEILFNEANILEWLFPVYFPVGLLILVLAILTMLKPALELNWMHLVSYILVFIVFLIHSFGLGLRWYISGHAPWSNGYESMIYAAWAVVLAGLLLSRQYFFPLAATSILAGFILLVSHLSWMDPQITTLVPVLKSVWLTIHVSVIMSSYGFMGMCAILAVIALLLMALQTEGNRSEIGRTLSNLSYLSERTMQLGMAALVAGTLFGAVWANESWGRYWGWDPKETWTLITILVYSVVLHLRLIPSLNKMAAYHIGALFAFTSILMTYFGVNYYLSGMHSYAGGDAPGIPWLAYAALAAAMLLSVVALQKEMRRKS